MVKLKENQFYCLSCRARRTCKADDISVKTYKNKRTGKSVPTMKCECPKCGTNMNKFVKHSDAAKLRKKYN